MIYVDCTSCHPRRDVPGLIIAFHPDAVPVPGSEFIYSGYSGRSYTLAVFRCPNCGFEFSHEVDHEEKIA